VSAPQTSVYLSEGQRLPVTSGPRTISFRNVHFSYPSRPDSPILRGVDLSIERGRSIAIAGGSGSGKSTLVNLLVRYYDPISGSITYGADDIRDLTPESWRERVSIVPQDPALFSQTVAENIAYGKPDATMSEIREAARLANCDFINELPQGYDTPVGAKAAQLSGGQRQRLAIARALVRKPAILILDEATSALDAASETLVNDAVKRITATNDLTTILIAHRLSTLKTADEIVFMEDGQVVERGTYEELAQEGTAFWRMVRSQLLSVYALCP
jgi:ATP-binding cassette subfamily B (MDR/TAP) protein 10